MGPDGRQEGQEAAIGLESALIAVACERLEHEMGPRSNFWFKTDAYKGRIEAKRKRLGMENIYFAVIV